MQIQIDFRASQPIYLQIVEQIRQMIQNGGLKPGDQLPTVRQMATDLRVNFNTVARAYRLLDEANLISTQQGRGTYIWDAPGDETNHALRVHGLEALTVQFISHALKLGFSAGEIQEMVQRTLAEKQQDKIPAEQ